MRELGVSAATLPLRKLTADRLAHAIDAILTDPAYRDNAHRVAARLSAENGAANAVAAVERLIDQQAIGRR
jgi:UDP:flavonoid glycosyltransferase YjiC (YdhE family)